MGPNQRDLVSGIRVGLHDEIFHGATPVLAGVDAHSTYCYLLAGRWCTDRLLSSGKFRSDCSQLRSAWVTPR